MFNQSINQFPVVKNLLLFLHLPLLLMFTTEVNVWQIYNIFNWMLIFYDEAAYNCIIVLSNFFGEKSRTYSYWVFYFLEFRKYYLMFEVAFFIDK